MSLNSILTETAWTSDIASMIKDAVGGKNGETLLYYIEDQSEAAGEAYINYIESVINKIDLVIDLDFQRTPDWQEGFFDINLYDKNPNDTHNVVGEVNPRSTNLQVVVFLRDGLDTSSGRNTFLHEFLHSLGLGEPGADPRFDQTDTAISYNLGKATDWQNEPTAADTAALMQLWGPENDSQSIPSPGLIARDKAVDRLYTAAFGRMPDQEGVSYWNNLINDKIMNYQGVAQSFVNSPEFSERFGSDINDEAFITNLYTNVLGRAPDTNGLEYWLNEMDTNGMSRSSALIGFADSTENRALFESLSI